MSTEADLVGASSARDLIPGDPRRLNEVAGLLQSYSIDLAGTAVAFATLDSSTWTGQAADQFRAAFSPAPGHWRTAADAFAQASRAVSVYATSLLLAQDDAADALVRFRRGMEAMNHDAVTGGRGGMGATMGADDPGRHDRDLAVIAVDEARARVRTAGTTAHHAVREATSNAPEGPAWWQTTAAALGVLAADGAEDLYNNVLVPVINGVATFGYASNTDPLGTLSVLGGLLLILGGGAVDVGGAAVCATGVGCVATPAAEAAGTGMIVTGWGAVLGGAASIGATAAANPITIVERTGRGPSARPAGPDSSRIRTRLNLLPSGRQAQYREVVDDAELTAVWEELSTGGQEIPTGDPNRDLVIFPDGSTVQWRKTSASGGATIDAWPSGEAVPTKVHLR